MVSSASPNFLKEKRNSFRQNERKPLQGEGSLQLSMVASAANRPHFLRIPPFPGAQIKRFAARSADRDVIDLTDEIRRLRVGGSYWGAQPDLPLDYVLVRSSSALGVVRQISQAEVLLWQESAVAAAHPNVLVINDDCDPWHMVSSAASVCVEHGDEVRVIAAILGVPRYLFDPSSGRLAADTADAKFLLEAALSGDELENPFTGEPMEIREAVALCGFWRKLIDSNRTIEAGVGFAFWKQSHTAPLLWSGSKSLPFVSGPSAVRPGASVAVWRSKCAPEALDALDQKGVRLVEVEDGFLRSRGLGADCIPPLSIVVDHLGAHFDPSGRSELEDLLQYGSFSESVLARARNLLRLIIAAGLGKYEQGNAMLKRPAGSRRHVLVTGQVEDDRAVLAGGCGLYSNLALLKKAREKAPDAYILYKPHPDVLAGHRRGAVSNRTCLEFADEIVSEVPIAALIDMVDEVHVNTSLAGFEALLRGTAVTTFGVPFYAGWGLTKDFGPIPSRRTARRTVDELAAAALLLYPRYYDPVTGIPCPAEVVVARLSAGQVGDTGVIVGMRRLQGKLMRRVRSLVQ